MEIKNDDETAECAKKSFREIVKKYTTVMPLIIEKGIYDDDPKSLTEEEKDKIIDSVATKLWFVCKIGLGKELVQVTNSIIEKENELGRKLTDEETKDIIDTFLNKIKKNLQGKARNKDVNKNGKHIDY